MVCIQCGTETQVTNSRPRKRSNQIWRRRECTDCGSIFTTEETIDYSLAWRVERNGDIQPFLRDKLFMSLHRSLQHRSASITDAAALTQTVMNKLSHQLDSGLISSRTITQTAQVALNRFDKAASVHYQAFHK